MHNLICLLCGKQFTACDKRIKYCSQECEFTMRGIRAEEKKLSRKTNCLLCGKEFIPKRKGIKYCSKQCACTANSQGSRDKAKQTSIERYGETHYSKTKEFKERVSKTSSKNSGYSWPSKNPEVKEKVRIKYKKDTGYDHPAQNPTARKKQIETTRENLGCDYPMQNKIVFYKSHNTVKEKYNVDNVSQIDWVKEKKEQTNLEKRGVKYSLLSPEVLSKAINTCMEKYGVPYYCMSEENSKKCGAYSKTNQYWEGFFKNLFHNELGYKDLDIQHEFYIPGVNKKYDLKIGNILLEIDPTETHNSTKGYMGKGKPIKKKYHQERSLVAEANGYHCIHMFNWDHNENFLNRLIGLVTKRKRLYHGDIKKINGKQAAEFYNANHLQGKCQATVHYGLFIKGELINAMSFTNNKGKWTLVRFASKQGYRVAHGAEKLFNTFIKEYNPSTVTSFSDITKHSGGLYNALGFTLEKINPPSYRWVKGKKVYRRRDCQKKSMHRLEGFNPNYKYKEHKDDLFWKRTEKQIMESKGYVIVYDSGMRRHVRHNKN